MATDAASGSEPEDATGSVLVTAFKTVIAFAVVGALAAAFAISYAALIFSGPLSPYLGTGISLVLTGGAAMALVACRTVSIPGTILAPQDATTVLLAAGAGSIVAGLGPREVTESVPTVLALIFFSTLAAGLSALACRQFRLGELVRFLPYPVIGGFMAATGYLLVIGGIGMTVGAGPGLGALLSALTTSHVAVWLPWSVAGAALALVSRRVSSDFTLPTFVLIAGALFYSLVAATGLGLSGAREAGLLLGPFDQFGFAWPPVLLRLGSADLGVVLSMLPTIAAVAGMTVLGTLLNLSGLETALGREPDPDRDLKASGGANIVTALVGGVPGYAIMAETVLGYRMGLRGLAPAFAAALGCILVLLFGPTLLAAVPVGLVAMLIIFIGTDFLIGWVWDRRNRLSRRDRGIILLILAVAAVVGFLEALAAGLLAATVIFVVSYAQLDIIRLRTTAAHRRSRVERSDSDLARLSGALSGTVIYELDGYLFFGTAHGLLKQVRSELSADGELDGIIVDGSRLDGIDVSAAEALARLSSSCRAADVDLVLTGFSGDMAVNFLTPHPELADRLGPALDTALERLEEAVLERGHSDWTPEPVEALLTRLSAIPGLERAVSRLRLKPGETLLDAGDTSRDIYLVLDGNLLAEIETPLGDRSVVAKFRPGAMIGEIAFYAQVPRTATIRAESFADVVRIGEAAIDVASDDPLAELHHMAAAHLARRVMRLNRLFADAGI